MRRATICAILPALAAMLPGASPPRPLALTIVLEFRGPHSDRSVDAMKREVEAILGAGELSVNWQTRRDLAAATRDHLVVFRFKGKCILEPVGYLMDERGPMAFTYETDGHMQPFGEVACDQVTATVRPAMSGGDFAKADLLLGRALGRVMAHELFHMLSGSGGHSRQGLAAERLTGSQLIAPVLEFSAEDFDRIYTLP